ncbi:MAG TPA: OmpA family protein, partial [Bacteroidia bacterium]|nr:OmpA family protein [Bacteroidia bacterium]
LIKNAEVILTINDSIKLKQITQGDGKYTFLISRTHSKVTLRIETSKNTSSDRKDLCGFFASRNIEVIDLLNGSVVVRDFFAQPFNLCNCVPLLGDFFFEKNKSIPSFAITNDTITIDSALKTIHNTMINFSKMKICFSGHSNRNEKDDSNLSSNRALYLANRMIEMGISKERILIKDYKATKPIYSRKATGIRKFKISNQRVTTNVISYVD